jgi:hypothetical protein
MQHVVEYKHGAIGSLNGVMIHESVNVLSRLNLAERLKRVREAKIDES